MQFKINVLPYDLKARAASREQVNADARDFVVRILQNNLLWKNGENKVVDAQQGYLALDLLNARFWGTLARVDGRTYEPNASILAVLPKKEDLVRENAEKRAWAKNTFSYPELEDILNIAVNQALLRPIKTAWPGTYRGHSILYRELVEKEGSMFAEAVTPDFRILLNNGRFWEELSEASRGCNSGYGLHVVHDVLEQHFDDLNPTFAAQGLELVTSKYEAVGGRKVEDAFASADLESMNEKAIEHYILFLEKINAGKHIPKKTIETLLKPYLKAVLAFDTEYDRPYFHGRKDEHVETPRGYFAEKLKAPIVQEYCMNSVIMQKHIAEIFRERITYQPQNNGYGNFVKKVLENVPEPKAIMNYLLQGLVSSAGILFFEESRKAGYDLHKFLP